MTEMEKNALSMLEKRLTKNVNSFLKQFGIRGAMSNEFYAETDKKRICFAIFQDKEGNILFLERWAELFPEITKTNISDFTLSILHEVGHICDPYDEPAEESDLRDECAIMVKKGKIAEGHKEYFNLPSEIKATTWAHLFLMAHYDECLVFDNKCVKLIHDFCTKYLTDY